MVLQRDFIEVRGNDLYIDDVSSLELVKKYGSPLFVMSKGHICSRFDKLQNMMKKHPNTLPLFASKSFSCKAIYHLAKQYDIGIDVLSAGEISIAVKAGFDPKKINFHGNNKLPSEIEYAIENGIDNFIVDNFYEIELIQQYASKRNIMIQSTLRVTPGVTAGANEFIQTGAVDTKFGFSSHDGTYLKAIQNILDSSNIEFVGIHCHIGSQIEDIQAYIDAMNKFVLLSYEIYDTFNIVIKKLNAGGGYGIAYVPEDKPLDFDLITDTIMDIITKGFEARNLPIPMVLIEPGRYVVGNAGVTLYTVGSTKDIPGVRKYISIDGGMTDNIRSSLYDAKYEALIVNKASEELDTVVTIAGKNCESGDILCKDVAMASPEAGDILAMFTTGAYHYSMSSNYNQLPKPAVVFTHEGTSKVVVRRQTFDDLVLFDEE